MSAASFVRRPAGVHRPLYRPSRMRPDGLSAAADGSDARTTRTCWPRSVAAAWSAWVGLLSRGKDPVQVGVHGIANNAVRYVRNGRRVANRSCGRGAMDVYHPEARKARGFRVINPDSLDETVGGSPPGVWTNSCTPADEACFRVDHEQWLGTLPPRRRRIAELLTEGHGTLEVAREIGVTPAAISQARSWLCESWRKFQGEVPEGCA